MPSTLAGRSLVRSGLPSWTHLSPTLNLTPANVWSPVGTAARVLFGMRPPTSSARGWLAFPWRSTNVGPVVLAAGAARQAAATQAAAQVARRRDTGGPPTAGGRAGRARLSAGRGGGGREIRRSHRGSYQPTRRRHTRRRSGSDGNGGSHG